MNSRAIPEKDGPKYPRMMKHKEKEVIVLFHGEKEGIVIHSRGSKQYPIGYTSNNWNLGYFKEWKGEVVIST